MSLISDNFKERSKSHMVPLRDLFIFPSDTKSIVIGRRLSVNTLEMAMQRSGDIVLATQHDPDKEEITTDNFFEYGVLALIRKTHKNLDGSYRVIIEGLKRVRILEVSLHDDILFCSYIMLDSHHDISEEYSDLFNDCINILEKNQIIKSKYNISFNRSNLSDKVSIIDHIASKLPMALSDQAKFLSTTEINKRLELLYGLLLKELKRVEINQSIKNRIKEKIEKTEKEFFIKQQIKALREELGQDPGDEEEKESLKDTIEGSLMTEEAKKRAGKEYKRLASLPVFSPEVGVIRNYIDWLLSLPWKTTRKDRIDLDFAGKILNRHHYGLDRIKARIIEHLAVERLSNRSRPTILCFVGAPGTGKTSLAKSIAEATNREFVRISLGGTRDEAEIRGHRMTYIGSMPGRIIQSMRKVKSNNPVFLLDEIDKLGHDFRGDPAAALLEVLDPDQNRHFSDNYLEVEYDLSKVMFITTANTLDIPKPLLDRMEIIQLEGYTDMEKLNIAKEFLISRSLDALGLKKDNISFSDETLYEIIHSYTREAGVRNFQREIDNVLRKLATFKVKEKRKINVHIEKERIPEYLGVPKYYKSNTFLGKAVGEATGLAWTPQGGDILSIEVIVTQGSGKILMTGTLGKVMKESAQTALSFVKNKVSQNQKFPFDKSDIHIHIPEGAVPKEGPSAGITLVTAIYSAFSENMVNKEIAMTGEITLKGRILPVGGIKTKLLAAHRRDIFEVIIPRDNARDLKEMDQYVMDKMKIHLLSDIDEVFSLVVQK